MKQAYAQLAVKAMTDEPGGKRKFTGIASTISTDRMDDVVVPKGAKFKLPLPLLWQHNSKDPIGWVVAARVGETSIEVDCEVHNETEPGALKDFLDKCWQQLKAKLVQGLSIGFNPIETAQIDGSWGMKFLTWEWLELSPVTIAANGEASITAIKAADTETRAALGLTRRPVLRLADPPGASGITKAQPASRGLSFAQTPPKGTEMSTKTLAERIAEFQAKRATTLAALNELVNKSLETGETLDADQKQKSADLRAEIAEIDEHIKMLTEHQKMMATTVTPAAASGASVVKTGADDTDPSASAVNVRSGGVIRVERNLQKGVAFARFAKALAMSKGNLMQAAEIAKQWDKTSPEVGLSLKAAVAAGTTTGTTWAEPLVEYQTMQGEFIDLLRPMTILGKIQGLRKVPFMIRMAGKTQGSTVGWVGEGLPKPVSELGFNETTLGQTKIAGIVVITQELARSADPAAEGLIKDDMIESISQFMDEQFVNPAVAAVAGVNPASITNGVTPVVSTGSTIAAISDDVEAAMNKFIAAKLSVSSGVWIMHPSTALSLSLKRTSQDVFAYRDEMKDGTFHGLPFITSESVPSSVSGGAIVVLAIAREIFYADDGAVSLDVSEQASLQMNSTPSAGAQAMVSLWQTNQVGIRAERYVNWQRRRAAAVTYIDQVNW